MALTTKRKDKQMLTFSVQIHDPELEAKIEAYKSEVETRYGVKFNRSSWINSLLVAFFAKMETKGE